MDVVWCALFLGKGEIMELLIYVVYHIIWLLIAALLYTTLGQQLFLVSLVSGLVVYVVTFHVLCWTLPLRRHVLPELIVCLGGSFLVTALGQLFLRDSLSWHVMSGLAGAFIAYFIAVKVASPPVNTILCSPQAEDLKRYMSKFWIGIIPPSDSAPQLLWPARTIVRLETMVVWHLLGEPGTEVFIEFKNDQYNPFNPLTDTMLRGVIPEEGPGTIVGGPVITGGRGRYSIRVQPPGNPGTPQSRRYIICGPRKGG